MKNIKTLNIIGAAAIALSLLTGCTNAATEAYQERQDQQAQYVLQDSLEKHNLEAKRDRENDPNAVRYVYVLSYAQIIGYYVIEGKISDSGSQLGPELEVVSPCVGCDRQVVDSAQDDGTFGSGDPGIFFFLADGTMVETSLDYIVSDQPLNLLIEVPQLG